jgi:hypothetical protein
VNDRNAALIAGNTPQNRLERLRMFWRGVEHQRHAAAAFDWLGTTSSMRAAATATSCGKSSCIGCAMSFAN